MTLNDYLPEMLLIGDERARTDKSLPGRWADAGNDAQARCQLAIAAQCAEHAGAPGLLLQCADLGLPSALRRHDDVLIEQLESSDWEMLYLAHEDGRTVARAHQRPDWLHCDAPPAGLIAMALRLPLLRRILAEPLEIGSDAGLRAAHWLGLLAWQGARACRPGAALALWPAFPTRC